MTRRITPSEHTLTTQIADKFYRKFDDIDDETVLKIISNINRSAHSAVEEYQKTRLPVADLPTLLSQSSDKFDEFCKANFRNILGYICMDYMYACLHMKEDEQCLKYVSDYFDSLIPSMLNFMPQAAKACLDANISEILKEKSFVRMAEEDLKTETGTTPKPTEGRRVSWTEFVSAGKGAE